MSDTTISHAFVVPSKDFDAWLDALRPYVQHFPRVAIVRGTGGQNLNAYRNVSAVTVNGLWVNDNPVEHIEKIYPQVVRIDVVQASTPQQLAALLQARIAADNRYGDGIASEGAHIRERFVLEWPTDFRPYNIVTPFTEQPTGSDADVMGLVVQTDAGSKVLAAVPGKVTKQWAGEADDDLKLGKYVQITTRHYGVDYQVTYAGLSSVRVPLHSDVTLRQEIGRVAGESFTVIVRQAGGGLSGYRLPDIVNPLPLVYVTNFRVRPIAPALRVRSLPSTDGEVLGALQVYDLVIPQEPHGIVLEKVGVEGKWLAVRMPDGREGWAAAWFMEATEFKRFALDVNPVGVNLDQLHPLGTPDPSRLGGLGWVRFGYNVSNNSGSEDLRAAFDRYAPIAERYARAGYKVMFATSHQTYGEGKNEFWPWPEMNDDKWARLTARFADMMGSIAQQWSGTGLVDCWQVWNEQDAHIGAVASVPMTAQNYGRMLGKVVPAIRASDNKVYVITGGHTAGPGRGSEYAKQAINMLGSSAIVDGVAFHPYGRGSNPSSSYAPFGHIDESMRAYAAVLPDKPVWITEWGVLDRGNDDPVEIANYATNFISHLKATYPGKVACMIWYAWAQGMHNGYGLVDSGGNPRPPLTERFLNS